MEPNQIEKIKELVSRSRVCMLGTSEDGFMKFRPMSHVDIDDEGVIWFFTSKDSWKAEDIRRDSSVQLIYINESDSIYLRSIARIAHCSADGYRVLGKRRQQNFNLYQDAFFGCDGYTTLDGRT